MYKCRQTHTRIAIETNRIENQGEREKEGKREKEKMEMRNFQVVAACY